MPRGEPADVADHGHDPRLDAAVVLFYGLVVIGNTIPVFNGLLLDNELFDIVAEPALIAFQREHIVGLFETGR